MFRFLPLAVFSLLLSSIAFGSVTRRIQIDTPMGKGSVLTLLLNSKGNVDAFAWRSSKKKYSETILTGVIDLTVIGRNIFAVDTTGRVYVIDTKLSVVPADNWLGAYGLAYVDTLAVHVMNRLNLANQTNALVLETRIVRDEAKANTITDIIFETNEGEFSASKMAVIGNCENLLWREFSETSGYHIHEF